jgi:iron complex transport system substrate-binding protein
MRILSLLPSATEIVYLLGLDDDLVAVTSECDHPPAARAKPAVSFPVVADTPATTTAAVDAAVGDLVAAGRALYRLDEEQIRSLRPELILAQDLCRVCAVPSGDVNDALDRLGLRATVLSLDPGRLDDVLATVGAVAEAAGIEARGAAAVGVLVERLEGVRRRVAGAPRRRVLELEWPDPPYVGGHWVPDMVDAAGGTALLAAAGRPSPRVDWDDIARQEPEVVVLAPCGYGLADAVAEATDLLRRPPLAGVTEVWAADGSAFFSRPGPRVVEGVESLAWVLHPDRVPSPPPGRVERLR